MEAQKKMLEHAILNMIGFSVSKNADEHLVKIAQKHSERNIDAEMYDIFMDSLLVTLSDCYPLFSNECAVAWRIILSPSLEFMKHYGELGQ